MVKDPTKFETRKHIDVRYHFVMDAVERRQVKFVHVNTDYNVADLLTKLLNQAKTELFRSILLGLTNDVEGERLVLKALGVTGK